MKNADALRTLTVEAAMNTRIVGQPIGFCANRGAETNTYLICTHGMNEIGAPELEIRDVPLPSVVRFAGLLSCAADYLILRQGTECEVTDGHEAQLCGQFVRFREGLPSGVNDRKWPVWEVEPLCPRSMILGYDSTHRPSEPSARVVLLNPVPGGAAAVSPEPPESKLCACCGTSHQQAHEGVEHIDPHHRARHHRMRRGPKYGPKTEP